MNKALTLIAVSACLTITPAVHAECSEPERPKLPDPATAVTPEMLKAKNDVKNYMAQADTYLNCKKLTSRQHNKVITGMESLAKDFNKIVRSYKKKISG
jgi:hypothetical protein